MSLFKSLAALLRQDWYRGIFALCIGLLLPEYFAVAAVIPALIFLLRSVKREGRKLAVGRLGICLLIYIGTMFMSILVSLHPIHSLLMALLWTVLIIGYFLVTAVVTDRERIRITLKTVSVVLAICAAISLLQYLLHGVCGWEWVPLTFWEPLDTWVFSYFPMELILTWADVRTASVFNNPNLYGQFTVMLLPFIVYWAITAKQKAERRTAFILAGIALCGVLFTFSRGSYLALILTAFVFLVLMLARSKTARKLMAVVALAAVLFVLIPNPFMDRLATISPEDIAVNARLNAWGTAWNAILERPLFGYGAGTLNAMDIIQAAGIEKTPHTHNAVLELLVEGGMMSLLPFLFICWYFLAGNLKIRRMENRRDSLLSVAFLSMFSGFVLNIMVDYPFSVPKLSLVFMLLLGLADVHFHLCGVKPLRQVNFKKSSVK